MPAERVRKRANQVVLAGEITTKAEPDYEHSLRMKDNYQNRVRWALNRFECYYGADFPIILRHEPSIKTPFV